LRYVFGVDAFQALQLGLNYIATRLTAADPPPFWFKPTEGAGFARSIPTFLPLVTQRRLEQMIDQVGLRWAKRQKRATAPRSRRKSNSAVAVERKLVHGGPSTRR
jgi:hypothetical protein